MTQEQKLNDEYNQKKKIIINETRNKIYEITKQAMSDKPAITEDTVKEFFEFYYQRLSIKDWETQWNNFLASKQPIREKGWEILAYKFIPLTEKEVVIYKDSPYWYGAQNGNLDFSILSVRRLPDGEVFTVGDRVTYAPVAKFSWIIDHFKESSVDDGQMLAMSKNDEHVEALNDNLKKVSALFKTIDGKEIFEGDEFWVATDNYVSSFMAKEKDRGYWKEAPLFLSKESAENHIENTRLQFSKEDMRKAFNAGRARFTSGTPNNFMFEDYDHYIKTIQTP